VAVGTVIIAQFVGRFFTDHTARIVLTVLEFMPLYAVALGIVFLISPHIRLIYADLRRGHRTTKHERIVALAPILAVFPLALLWLVLFPL
jgi:hypothetical protein